MRSFNEEIKAIAAVFEKQKKMAKKADKLLEECEKLEVEMGEKLEELKKLFPEEYENFLQSFNKEK